MKVPNWLNSSEIVSRALSLPSGISVSEWADANRILGQKESPEPGRWQTIRTPYLREIMDAYSDPSVRRIVLKAAAQVGKTSCMLNCLAYTVDQIPGRTLYVLPTEDIARTYSKERVEPMFTANPELYRRMMSGKEDKTRVLYTFDTMVLHFGWANSPATLSSFPVARVFLDEINKFPAFSGRESDPVKLAEERAKNFWDRKIVLASTPTTPDGYISQEFERGDKCRFAVPCPHCGAFQILRFDQVKWPAGERDAERIRAGQIAWYDCERCLQRIDDHNKPAMLVRGVWCPEGCDVDIHGSVCGHTKETTVRSFHLNSLYSPWVTFSDMAAQFLDSKNNPAMLMNFVNSWQGEDWVEQTEEMSQERLAALRLDYKCGEAPEDAIIFTAGVDVQKECLYFVIRAWCIRDEIVHGVLVMAERIDAGHGDEFQQLEDAVISAEFEVKGQTLPVVLTAVDSAYRTDEVYEFCYKWRGRAIPTKGARRLVSPYHITKIERNIKGRVIDTGLKLWHFDTSYYKDMVQRMRTARPSLWHLPSNISQEYIAQASAERKIIERSKRTGKTQEVWEPRNTYVQNHFWDADVLTMLAADVRRISRIKTQQSSSSAYRPRVERENTGWKIGR